MRRITSGSCRCPARPEPGIIFGRSSGGLRRLAFGVGQRQARDHRSRESVPCLVLRPVERPTLSRGGTGQWNRRDALVLQAPQAGPVRSQGPIHTAANAARYHWIGEVCSHEAFRTTEGLSTGARSRRTDKEEAEAAGRPFRRSFGQTRRRVPPQRKPVIRNRAAVERSPRSLPACRARRVQLAMLLWPEHMPRSLFSIWGE
jgi:hypothetical protein